MSEFTLPPDFSGVRFVVATPEGRILQTGACPLSDFPSQQTLHPVNRVIAGAGDADHHWVQNGALELRPSMDPSVSKMTISADGVDEAVIEALPLGVRAIIDGEDYELPDGTLVLTSDTPRSLVIDFSLWPFLDHRVTIEVTA